jgi:tRNA(adenine34) deaminase
MAFPLPDPMRAALDIARQAAANGEVPVGAVIVRNGEIVATGANATRSGNDRLTDCDLWVTLEPCAMCAGAVAHARLARLYYAASDPKGGGVEQGACVFTQPTCHHRPEITTGLGEAESAALLKTFFAARR